MTALAAAAGWLVLCLVAANVWVAVCLYRRAGVLDAKERAVDCEHLRNLAVARLLEHRAQRLGVDPDCGMRRGAEA